MYFQTHIASHNFVLSQQVLHNILIVAALWFPKKSLQILLIGNHTYLSVSFRSSSKCLSCISSLIWGPINIPSLIFASLTFGNLFLIFESTVGFIHTFHKVSHDAQLYVQRGQINFLQKNNRRTDNIFLPWCRWCLSRPVAYREGGLGCSNPPRNSEDIGGVLDRMSKKSRRLDFLLKFTVFSYGCNLLNKGFF